MSSRCGVTADVLPFRQGSVAELAAIFAALVDTRPTAVVRRGVARWTVIKTGRFTRAMNSAPASSSPSGGVLVPLLVFGLGIRREMSRA